MGFIIKRLTEEDKEFFASFGFIQPLGGRGRTLAKCPEKWVSDREKNIFLIGLGGQGWRYSEEYPPDYYRLIINKKAISIEAYCKSEGNADIGIAVTWKIHVMNIPPELHYINWEDMWSIIEEAFTKEAFVGGFDTERNVVSVQFES